MRMNNLAARSLPRRGLTRPDVLALSTVLLLLVAVLPFSLGQVRARARQATCAQNLAMIGASMHIYANDNAEWYPIHFHRAQHTNPDEYPGECGVHWVGYSGSTPTLLKSQRTTPQHSPHASHPSRSLFMLLSLDYMTPEQFVCPQTRDIVDDLWNDGWDGNVPGVPGVNRFDFRGYDHLSYAYQLPYGRRARPRETMDNLMPLIADKGPYYEGDYRPIAPTGTINDRRSNLDAPREWIHLSIDELLNLGGEWQPFNSRNHGGLGQHVWHSGGHVTFEVTPIVGIGHDNIYTVQKPGEAPQETLIGVVPNAEQTWSPLTQTDSFLVP